LIAALDKFERRPGRHIMASTKEIFSDIQTMSVRITAKTRMILNPGHYSQKKYVPDPVQPSEVNELILQEVALQRSMVLMYNSEAPESRKPFMHVAHQMRPEFTKQCRPTQAELDTAIREMCGHYLYNARLDVVIMMGARCWPGCRGQCRDVKNNFVTRWMLLGHIFCDDLAREIHWFIVRL
jgi:hypothetical protein